MPQSNGCSIITHMPTIARFANCSIAVYPQDHNPPHFHLRGPDFELLVEIGSGRLVGRSGRVRDVSEALNWAEEHQALLMEQWQRLNP